MALQGMLGVERNPSFGLMSDFSSLDAMAKISEVAPEWSFSEGLSNFNPAALPLAPAPGFSIRNTQSADGGRPIKIDFDKGTTTLAFKYQGGICVCADSRATGGNYIGSQSVRKIIPINDYMLGTMAGGAADCTYWERILSERCRIHELRNRERISIAAASKLLANILYNYKGMGLSLGVMICGWDKRGASIYYVDNEGNRMPGKLFSVGSGSPYAYGVLDNHYRYDMTDEEAFDLGRRAIYHATHRDAASGGIVRVYSVKADGWKVITETDCKELHYKYQEEKMISG